jgi:hypothetical protein
MPILLKMLKLVQGMDTASGYNEDYRYIEMTVEWLLKYQQEVGSKYSRLQKRWRQTARSGSDSLCWFPGTLSI